MVLKTDGNGNFVLPATAVLSDLSEQLVSRHRDLGLRHPLGVFNTSTAVVAKRVDRVLSLLRVVVSEEDSGHPGSPEEHVYELLESQEALLHGLMQHMDDCINILRGFTVDKRAFNKNHHVKAYRRVVQEYRDHIGKVVCRIKHQQGRLCLLTVRMGSSSFAGYFVAVGLADGSVGPDPNIHKDGLTAFSFNRDLRYHLCHVLLASGHLARAVEGLTGGGSSEVTPAGEPGTTDSVLSVSDLAETYFPDEYKKPRPVLRLETPQNRMRRLVVEFVSSKTWRPFAGPRFKITLRASTDGSTRSWKVPYFFAAKTQAAPRGRSNRNHHRGR